MNTKRIISAILILIMLGSAFLTSCRYATDEGETSWIESSSPEEDSSAKNDGSSSVSSEEAEGSDVTEGSNMTDDSDATEGSNTTDGSNNTEDSDTTNDSDTTESSSTEESNSESEGENEMITDVMIGETLEAEYADSFTVARIFSDHMVLQRGEHIRVWGFAPESENGKKVSGSFKGMFAEALIENGEWCITFTARLEADVNGAEMKIYTDIGEVKFTDVLVGDVYLVMGQSNAQYQVKEHLAKNDPATQGGGQDAIDPNSIIRLNRLYTSLDDANPQLGTDKVLSELYSSASWTKTDKTNTLSFSAIGYYFARHLTEQNPDVPVGLMQIAKGGAPLVSFLPNDLAEKYDSDYLDTTDGKYYSNINREHKGRYFYNCFLAPIDNYAIAGVVWYQGESNNSLIEADKYNAAFADLMTRLRSSHNLINKNFPVFITEFPSIYEKPANHTTTWHFMELGLIRSYMGSIPTVLKNSYVAASGDVWADKTFYNNLHPNCKYEQAERLAAIANVVVYNNGTLDEATGPIFESATISADKKTVIITFSNVGEGLTTADGGTAVKGMVGLNASVMGHIAVTPVSATITAKNQVTVVFNTEVKAVAYNYNSSDFYGDTINLCNSNGCVASGFLTPYKNKEIGTYKTEDFKETSLGIVKFKNKAIDTLKINGTDYFTVGKVVNELAAANNKVIATLGSSKLAVAGWIGFGHKITMFGYSVDGSDAVFDSYPNTAGTAVINAGGEYAQRFSVSLPIGNLALGEHTVDILVLVDAADGIAVKILSFTLEVVEKPEEDTEDNTGGTQAPDSYEAPSILAAGYGLKGYSVDFLTKDGTYIYKDGGVVNKLAQDNNTVTVANGTEKLRIYGWAGFETEIDKFGYAINANSVIETAPIHSDGLCSTVGYNTAKRLDVYIDISKLEAGAHAIDLLVRINMSDGSTAVLKIMSFTLIIEGTTDTPTTPETPETTDFPPYYASGYGIKGESIDTLKADETTLYHEGVAKKIKADDNIVTVANGTKQLEFIGWIGFETTIDMLGYAIDGTATMATAPSTDTVSDAIIASGGANAKKYRVYADISDLAAGEHTFKLLVRINMNDGTKATLEIISFTLIIEE